MIGHLLDTIAVVANYIKSVSTDSSKYEGWKPQGGTRSVHDGGSDVFFWIENLHHRYFFFGWEGGGGGGYVTYFFRAYFFLGISVLFFLG